MQKYQWVLTQPQQTLINRFSNELNISPLLARILVNRGIASLKEANAFLYANVDSISSPFLLPDIDKAVEIITDAVNKKDRIAVYGDYDCDGITSTYVLSCMLKKIGADVVTYIPSRMDEGYGLNLEAISKLVSENIKLLVTVDCGIAAVNEIKYAKDNGIQCIVTDHHTLPEVLPEAGALVNPKSLMQDTPYYDLAGVGVAWKTGWAVLEKILGPEEAKAEAYKLLDIVAIGTVADMVALTGENRIIVKYGLENLSYTTNIGLQALIAEAGIDGKMDTYKIGFALGPRLNAVGRMSNAEKALRLLEEKNQAQARARAALLSAENSSRQNVEKGILVEAERLIEEQTDPNDKVLVLASPSWHEGVIGIVASKLLEKRYLPVICLTIKSDEAKGSARSIPGFNIYEAIKAGEDFLTRYGGHAMAAGLSLEVDKIDIFRRVINDYAQNIMTSEMLTSKKYIDAVVTTKDISSDFMEELKLLEPYGQGNSKPIFMLKDIKISQERVMGKNNEHLRFDILQEERILKGIAWGMAEQAGNLRRPLDIIFSPQENTYNGRTSIQAVLIDIQPAAKENIHSIKKSVILQQLVKSGRSSWQDIERHAKNDINRYFPDRDILAVIYKIILKISKISATCSEEEFKSVANTQGIPWETFYLALVIFYELRLIKMEKKSDGVYFHLTERGDNKVELENSPLYRKIKEEYNLLKDIG